MAGRGFGKTLAGAKWLTARIDEHRGASEPLHIALVGATLDEARRVMVEGRSGLLEVADAWVSDWQPSLRRLTFRTGAVATLFSGASPEQLRGPEHHLAWCDELAKWEKAKESWDMLQLGLRLGDWPRAIVTTTPRPGVVLEAIMADPDTVTTGGPTRANPHVSEAWQRSIHSLYAGTRLGAQELEGRLLPDKPGALWSVELLERCRLINPPRNGEGDHAKHGGGVASAGEPGSPDLCAQRRRGAEGQHLSPRDAAYSETPQRDGALPGSEEGCGLSAPLRLCANPTFLRLVIAVDPPVVDGTCGIIACARDADGRAHILADHSITAASPERWSRAVADAVRIWTTTCSGAGRSAGSSEGDGAHRRTAPASAGAHTFPTSPVIASGARQPSPASTVIASPEGARQTSRAGEVEAGLLRQARNDERGGAPAAVIASPEGARQPSPSLTPLVVAEQNQGGKLVKSVLHTADPSLRVKLVTATVGKAERAAPVAMLFEAGKVVLHGRFPELEAEMLGMIAGGDYEGPGKSPDRADAMVWGLTELMLGPEHAPPRIRSL